MPKVKCKVCGKEFNARQADLDRGWAKCCSKSCAAKLSNEKTGKWDKYNKVKHKKQSQNSRLAFTGRGIFDVDGNDYSDV